MKRCETCVHFVRDRELSGVCTIKLPPWLYPMLTPLEDSPRVHVTARCDLHTEQSDA